jgi:hypothetical protein
VSKGFRSNSRWNGRAASGRAILDYRAGPPFTKALDGIDPREQAPDNALDDVASPHEQGWKRG